MTEWLTFDYIGEDEEGEFEAQGKLPAVYEVCERCHGRGTHDHPAFSNGFTRDDDFVDEDFIEDYMAGHYDVVCEECGGKRVVLVVDRELAERKYPDLLKDYDKHLEVLAEIAAEEAAERRYFAAFEGRGW